MRWKSEYKLGDSLVDSQHEELFKRVAALNKIIESEDAASRKQECIDAILFLKDYAVNHFAAEERFQELRNYRYLEFHKAIHGSFVTSVLEAEKQLVKSDFSIPVIKTFCGFLSMWLIYHVAGADQKIVNDDVMSVAEFALAVSYEDCVVESLKEVFGTIFGDSHGLMNAVDKAPAGNTLTLETEYDETRNMCFTLSKSTALNLVNTITTLELTEVDELAYAALEQLAKTICNNVLSHAGSHDRTSEDGEFTINTKFGRLSVSLKDKLDQ